MKVTANILCKFDLGYLLKLEDGTAGQLRVIEMKGEALEHHLKSIEENLYGTQLQVYIIHRSPDGVLLSQFSPEERLEREALRTLEQQAKENCKIGQIYEMQITREMAWGYICRQIDGHLEAAVKGRQEFKNGDSFKARVISISESGNPIVAIANKS